MCIQDTFKDGFDCVTRIGFKDKHKGAVVIVTSMTNTKKVKSVDAICNNITKRKFKLSSHASGNTNQYGRYNLELKHGGSRDVSPQAPLPDDIEDVYDGDIDSLQGNLQIL